MTSRRAALILLQGATAFRERVGGTGGVSARGRGAFTPSCLCCGVVFSPSRPRQLHNGRRLMAEQQHYVLARKLYLGRNKKGLMGLRSGKQSIPQSRELPLCLLFSLTQGQSITESD